MHPFKKVNLIAAFAALFFCSTTFAFDDNVTVNGITTQGIVLRNSSTGAPYTAGSSDASAANQTAVQANPGSDATKATAVQGVTGGKPVPVSASSLPLPTGAAKESGGNLDTLVTNTTGLSTAALQSTGNATLTTINTTLGTPLQAGGTISAVTGITNALPAGTNLIGKVGIDQTTPGTTNKVSIGTDGVVSANLVRAFTPTGNTVYGSISTANTDQVVLAANSNRHGLIISNTVNSPDQITCRMDGGAVYDAGNSDYAGITFQAGGTAIFDSSMSNTQITCASPTAGSRYMIVEY